MQSTFKRFFGICLLLLLLTAALFFVATISTNSSAAAEVSYNVGGASIKFDYGQAVSTDWIFETKEGGEYYKIKKYNVSEQKNGVASSLLDVNGRVQKIPGTYFLDASNSNLVVPCDEYGSALDGSCEGTITITVGQTELTITIDDKELEKEYGETGSSPAVTVNGNYAVEFSLVSDGFAANADVGSYDLSIEWADPEQGKYYTIPAIKEKTYQYHVIPRQIEIVYDRNAGEVDAVSFNNYLLPDGQSVTSRTVEGVDGDILTAYFRLKEEHSGILSVGSLYEIEFYRYEVEPGDRSNYEVTISFEEKEDQPGEYYNYVRAGKGSVTVDQGEGDPERTSDLTYVCLSDDAFVCTYLDAIVKDYKGEEGEVVLTVNLYEGVSASLHCSLKGVSAGDVAVGTYELILKKFECAAVDSISFVPAHVRLVVKKCRLGDYSGEDRAEIGMSDIFEKQVEYPYDGRTFLFTLKANLAGAEIGGAPIGYSSCIPEDPNTEITFNEARVIVGKRHTGVSIQTEKKTVVYGNFAEGEIGVPYLNYGELGGFRITAEDGSISYAYRMKGGTSFNKTGLPDQNKEKVGEYEVRCTLTSALYETDPVIVDFTIVKDRAVLCYELSRARKTYGTTFSLSGAGISLYYSDENTKAGIFDSSKLISKDLWKSIGGTHLSAKKDGISASGSEAAAGDYVFSSEAFSDSYVIDNYFVYDAEKGRNVTVFTVEKADKPDVPALKYALNGRTISVTLSTTVRARCSRNQDMSSAEKGKESADGILFAGLTYGQTYYLQVRAEEPANYNNPSGWSKAEKIVITFPAPVISLSELRSDGGIFFAEELENAVEGYAYQYAIGTAGEWQDGLDVTGLEANTSYRLRFRAKKDAVIGAETSLKVTTLRSPVAEESVSCRFDRENGVLTVSAKAEMVQYRLLSPSGEVLSDWGEENQFNQVQADGHYLLQVRLAAAGDTPASEITEIELDLNKIKEPFSIKGFLADWFLAVVGGGLLLLMIVFVILFARNKKRIDQEGLGGE